MFKQIKLFVGLGNPGQKYANTRHNMGFVILDEIAITKHLNFKPWRGVASVSFYKGLNYKGWLLKPITFMNLSGIAVSSFTKCYKVDPEEIFVFCDDFSISLGKYKIRTSGSSGGHNGINSIISYLKTSSFPRMKLGTGPVPKSFPIPGFVLSEFTKKNKKELELIKKIAVNMFDEINSIGLDRAVSKLANKKR
jgi:PTH1 family peptidyl-tRNA hydrolase